MSARGSRGGTGRGRGSGGSSRVVPVNAPGGLPAPVADAAAPVPAAPDPYADPYSEQNMVTAFSLTIVKRAPTADVPLKW